MVWLISPRGRPIPLVLFMLILFAFAGGGTSVFADTKGKLTGKVTDTKGQPVAGANVLLVGTTTGAAADDEGSYVILNISVGVYDVRVSSVGYQTRLTKGVRIESGQTTTLNIVIAEEAVETGEVVTVAQRPLVDTRQTSSVAILNRDDISALPVQNLNDVVNLQAGVVDGHFRGGRIGEVQYQVDGVSVNNPYDNQSVVQLDKSVLQEVQVISGSFDAEYGQAMSGVVNAVLRSGSEEQFEASAEVYGGDYVLGPEGRRTFSHVKTKVPPSLQSFTATVSGPAGIPHTSFLLSGRRFIDDGYLYGERRFLPTDTSDFQQKIFVPTGDNAAVPMGTTREWSGEFKIANRSLPELQISYQAIGGYSEGRIYSFAFRYDPNGTKKQKHYSLVHGIDVTHSVSQTTFYTVSFRQNYFKYTDYAFASITNPAYYIAGPPRSDPNYELGAIIQGYDLGRFEQKTNALLLKGSLTSQVTPVHLLKVGFEGQFSSVGFGNPGTLGYDIINGKQATVRIVNDTLSQNFQVYRPRSFALFAQDRVEFTGFLLRAGLRLEYYDANASVPSDLQNPANVIQGAPLSHPQRTSKKIALAPRLGVSYPITAEGAIYFSYGHFYQMPGLGMLYANSNYKLLQNLQAGQESFGVMGNPDIKPEFTTQYEFGFKQQFGQFLGIDLSAFYKDVRDLLGVEFIDTYADATYARFTNVDFGSVNGIKLTLDGRITGEFSVSVNYTYQNAIGNSSDPRETANRAAAGQDPRPRQVPFDWDQRHTLNFSAAYTRPDDYVITLIDRFGSGSPYTPAIGSGFGANLETNSSVKPAWNLVDLRAEKYFTLGRIHASVFARVFNLLDERYANGFVFGTTGSPYYSLTPPADVQTLADPSRFATPRRIEIGVGIRL